MLMKPEKQTEDGEWADVDAAAAEGAEDAADEAGDEKDGPLPDAEVGDRVEGFPFELSGWEKNKFLIVNSNISNKPAQ